MASAAEQLAANLNFSTFAKAKELKQRILFVIGALIVYRLGTYIPAPGIDAAVLKTLFEENAGGIIGIFDTFAGGALSRMSIFSLNIFPYITASIIMQLMTAISPKLDALKKEGESGRVVINQYTRYLTVLLAGIQAFGIAVGLETLSTAAGSAVMDPGWFFRITTVITLVGGTIFLMWLGEQITSRGIGNGISLIIFAGIVATLPLALASMFELGRTGVLAVWIILVIVVLAVALISFVVFIERAQRRVTVQYPKRQVGNKVFAGDTTHLPLKINTAGVIPPIFASSLLLMPATVASFAGGQSELEWVNTVTAMLGHGQPLFMAFYAAMIIFFAFFYTAIVFNPMDTAENLRRNGGFVPGIRPGKNTAMYLDSLLTRLTAVGAAYLTLICLLPEFLMAKYSLPVYLGGTSLLIVVTVTMDTVSHIQSHLMAHQYEGLLKKAKLRGGAR